MYKLDLSSRDRREVRLDPTEWKQNRTAQEEASCRASSDHLESESGGQCYTKSSRLWRPVSLFLSPKNTVRPGGGEISRQRSSEYSGGKGQTGVVKRSKHVPVNHSKKERMCVEDLSRLKKLRARYRSRLSEFGVVSRSNDLLGLSRLPMLPLPLHMQLVREMQLFARFGGVVCVVWWCVAKRSTSEKLGRHPCAVRCGVTECGTILSKFCSSLHKYQRIGQRSKRGVSFGKNFRPKEKRCAGLDLE